MIVSAVRADVWLCCDVCYLLAIWCARVLRLGLCFWVWRLVVFVCGFDCFGCVLLN